jgi:hypothetical protein
MVSALQDKLYNARIPMVSMSTRKGPPPRSPQRDSNTIPQYQAHASADPGVSNLTQKTSSGTRAKTVR